MIWRSGIRALMALTAMAGLACIYVVLRMAVGWEPVEPLHEVVILIKGLICGLIGAWVVGVLK